MTKHTIKTLMKLKSVTPITMITAYDALFASLFQSHVDLILVGDSLNMSFRGEADTLSVTLDMMIYHTNAVCKGAPETFIVFDMPYGTYNNVDEALINAQRVYKETQANAIKIEGGIEKASIVRALTKNGIAVMGHIGLLPQFVRGDGGYSIKGKDELSKQNIIADAKAIEKAGAFALVIEGVKSDVAKAVTKSVDIPTIGIGAGLDVDGQVLVWSDMLGFYEEFTPKFVKKYIQGATMVKEAISTYKKEVQDGSFPSKQYIY
jgi:3-methyl-2-oxobutanoate hydroxymethyltransferase